MTDPMTVLDADTCLALLSTADVGRLAIAIANHPDIFPVNFVIDRGAIVFRTAEGTKLASAVLGTGVAFEVDGYDADAGEAWSVVVKGHATEIERMDQVFDALELPLFPWHAGPKHRFVRIEPTEISGRRFEVVSPPVGEAEIVAVGMTAPLDRPADAKGGQPAELFQLDRSTCLALLNVHHVGRLIIPGDDPYVIPVNYRLVDGAIVVRTTPRPVIAEAMDRPAVFEVDMFDHRTRSGWSVVVRGVARVAVAGGDQAHNDDDSPPWAPGERTCLIRIAAERVTGRLLRGAIERSSAHDRGYL